MSEAEVSEAEVSEAESAEASTQGDFPAAPDDADHPIESSKREQPVGRENGDPLDRQDEMNTGQQSIAGDELGSSGDGEQDQQHSVVGDEPADPPVNPTGET